MLSPYSNSGSQAFKHNHPNLKIILMRINDDFQSKRQQNNLLLALRSSPAGRGHVTSAGWNRSQRRKSTKGIICVLLWAATQSETPLDRETEQLTLIPDLCDSR